MSYKQDFACRRWNLILHSSVGAWVGGGEVRGAYTGQGVGTRCRDSCLLHAGIAGIL